MSNDPPRLILWGVSTSRTLRALWALHELALDYTALPHLDHRYRAAFFRATGSLPSSPKNFARPPGSRCPT